MGMFFDSELQVWMQLNFLQAVNENYYDFFLSLKVSKT